MYSEVLFQDFGLQEQRYLPCGKNHKAQADKKHDGANDSRSAGRIRRISEVIFGRKDNAVTAFDAELLNRVRSRFRLRLRFFRSFFFFKGAESSEISFESEAINAFGSFGRS